VSKLAAEEGSLIDTVKERIDSHASGKLGGRETCRAAALRRKTPPNIVGDYSMASSTRRAVEPQAPELVLLALDTGKDFRGLARNHAHYSSNSAEIPEDTRGILYACRDHRYFRMTPTEAAVDKEL
jgi:hypothetical protein